MTETGLIRRAIHDPLVIIGGVLACLMVLTCIPVSREKAMFLAVTSSNRFDDYVFSSRLLGYPNGDFVIYNGKLYLKIQGVRGAFLVTSFVRHYKWTVTKLQTFRLGHPEFESYLPDPDSVDGGIKWIR